MYKKEEFCFNCDTRLPVSRTLILMVKRNQYSDESFVDVVPDALREYIEALEKDLAQSKENDKIKEGDIVDIEKLQVPYIVNKEIAKFRTSNGCTILAIAGTETLVGNINLAENQEAMKASGINERQKSQSRQKP